MAGSACRRLLVRQRAGAAFKRGKAALTGGVPPWPALLPGGGKSAGGGVTTSSREWRVRVSLAWSNEPLPYDARLSCDAWLSCDGWPSWRGWLSWWLSWWCSWPGSGQGWRLEPPNWAPRWRQAQRSRSKAGYGGVKRGSSVCSFIREGVDDATAPPPSPWLKDYNSFSCRWTRGCSIAQGGGWQQTIMLFAGVRPCRRRSLSGAIVPTARAGLPRSGGGLAVWRGSSVRAQLATAFPLAEGAWAARDHLVRSFARGASGDACVPDFGPPPQ